MGHEAVLERSAAPGAWQAPLLRLALAMLALFALTFAAWREMAHQWWDIDTYSHILLIPAIIAWLVWIKRGELARIAPQAWWPGLAWCLAGLAIWLMGVWIGINTLMQGGAVVAIQGAALALLGLRTGLLLAFPLAYALLLVPIGDEIIPPLQVLTARMATALTEVSGVPTVVDGLRIATPAGLFNVAAECSGVKFLIAMLALGVLVAWGCFVSWRRRAWFLLACAVVPILANGVRAWATIYLAQSVGAERATGFDHIVYGWVFFGIVIALVLGVAWRWFEREPEDAGLTAAALARMPALARMEGRAAPANMVCAVIVMLAIGFALVARGG